MRPFFAAAILIAFCAFGAQGFAQEDAEESDYVEPTDNQVDLNKNAVEAMGEEDYERAVRLLEASIDLGALNVTWLNLGRAYHRLGRCEDARDAYLSVVSAPPVREPSPRLVDAKAEQYLEELAEMCESDDEEVEVVDQDPPESQDPPAARTQPPAEGSNMLGWAAVISGGTLMATGGIFYLMARNEHGAVIDALDDSNQASGIVVDMSQREAIERRERGDLFDTMALSTAVLGATVAGVGTYLLWSDSTTEVSVGAGPEGWTVGLSSRF